MGQDKERIGQVNDRMIGHVNEGQDNDRGLTNRIMTGQWQGNGRTMTGQ